jgi:hypothetical protein
MLLDSSRWLLNSARWSSSQPVESSSHLAEFRSPLAESSRRIPFEIRHFFWFWTMTSAKFIEHINCILCFWNFHPLLFLWLFKCLKKNLRKWTWKQEKMSKIFVFQPILNCFNIFKKWKMYEKFKRFNTVHL